MIYGKIAFAVLVVLYVISGMSVCEKKLAAWIAVCAGTAIAGLTTGVLVKAFHELFIKG